MIDRLARAFVLAFLRRVQDGELIVHEGHSRTTLGTPGALHATVTINDRRTWRSLLKGSLGLATSYMAGDWQCDDPVKLIRIAARNVRGLDRWRAALAPVRQPLQRLARRAHAPTVKRSRKQISAHYDLGNDLFSLFLDETLCYSSALFERPRASLHEASVAKLELVCRKLALHPDDDVLEIGSGWGGFAIHAAERYGCRVTTTTISESQYDLARQRVAAAGLERRVTVLRSDYRELTGRYDKLVSIEMIEAVGWQYFDTYFNCCSNLLDPHGAMLLQAITIDDDAYEVEKVGRSFINTLIFPGGCLPSPEVIDTCVRSVTDMHTLAHEDLTPHYVRTLQHWRERFARAAPKLEELGYDAPFRRLWDLYLAYSEAGFAERRITVGQYLLAKPHYRVPARSAAIAPRVSEPGRAFAAAAQLG